MKENQKNINAVLIPFAIVLGVLLLIGMVYRPLLLILLFLIAVSMLIGGLYFMFATLRNKMENEDETAANIEQNIEEQLSLCKREVEKNRKENISINNDIRELESSLDSTSELDNRNRTESKRILAGFYRELDLRKTKLDFYETCQSKLDTLLYNYNFTNTLREKQAKLNELQEEHYEDIAKMESLRSDMVFNLRYLETIESLSLKMLESNTLDTAQQLQLELKEITKELRRL